MAAAEKIKDLIRKLAEKLHKRRNLVLVLGCLVVFFTTYLLILPAFTMNKDAAANQGGIDVPGVTTVSEKDEQAAEDDSDAAEAADSEKAATKAGKNKTDNKISDPLKYEGRNYSIAVVDENSALPAGTEIKVEEIDKAKNDKVYAEYFKLALEAVQSIKDSENVSDLEFARFYDISLMSDGKEITIGKDKTVSVNIEYDKELSKDLKIENKDNIRVIHFKENKTTGETEAEVLDNKNANLETETIEDELLKEAVFDAESFSVYGLVYIKDSEANAEAAENADDQNADDADNTETEDVEKADDSANTSSEIDLGTAVVSTVDGSALPEDVEGHADVVAGKKAIASVEKKIDDLDAENTNYEVFDIALDNVNENEYKDGFKVEVNLPENIKGKDFRLFHIHDGEVEELYIETTGTSSPSGSENIFGFTFKTDGFSQFVLSYTVDFHYEVNGKMYDFSIPGGEKIALSELIEVLGILDDTKYEDFGAFLKEVANVEFTDESLVKVSKKLIGNDWVLKSLQPFTTEETLTITMKNGDVITVKVTDASEVGSSDGIKSLLTGVNITGAKQDGGKYIFYPEQPYGIELSFEEVNQANGQFPMDGSFTYQLPSGLVPTGEFHSNFLELTLSGGDHAGETVKLNYTINDSGLITFTWDKDTNSGAYAQLKDSLYSKFKLKIDCTYNGNGGELDFGNDIKKDVEVRNNGKINTPGKTARYNPVTNCVDYTVTVYSDGITKEVVITDMVSGSALTYKKDAVAETTVNGKEIPQPTSNDNGFTMTVPQMNDGETITIKYSAAIDLSKVTKNADGSWGTVDETGNKVVVNSEGNPDVEKENSGKDFEHKISMSNIGKTGENVEADENGHATVNWTIHANDNANVSMGGHTIKDTIDSGSNMTYNSKGIHVVAYTENGSVAYEKDITWGVDGLTKTADGKSWTWNIPNQSPDNQKLSYIITYTTDADVSGRVVKTQVKNRAESDNGGTSDGGSDISPHGGALTARKKAVKTDVTSKTVTWEINFDVPATGLDSAQIIDTMPTFWENGEAKYFDSYLGNSTITISPELSAGESYVATPSEDGKTLTIDFYKTENEQKVTGLSATGSPRKIRVQFQTQFNEDWLEEAADHQNETNYTNHTNTGRVLLNGQTIDVSATTKVENNEPGMSKVSGAQDTYYIKGNKLPAFPYTVTLTGISDDSFDDNGNLILEDTFNGKYLAFYHESQDGKGDNPHVGRILASTSLQTNPVWNNQAESESSVVTSPSAGKVVITITRENIPMDADGNYYPYYYVFYYLTVKDKIALEKLEKEIQSSDSGTYSLLNTVTNAKFGTATATADFSIDVLDKKIDGHDGKAYYENGNWLVDFKLDVNPGALALGDDEELTLTDDYTNLAVDYTTIMIQKEVDGTLVDTTSADGVSWNRKGNRVTYTLQNGVHYVITYKAKVTGTPESDGKVHFDNTAEYFGVKKWSGGEQIISSSGDGGGGSPHYGMQIFKHEKGAGSTPLQGAKFNLYRITEQGAEDSWQNQPSNAINTVTRDPILSDWTYVKTLTTGKDGVATTGSESLAKWTWYMLVEKEAPVYQGSEHYQLKNFGYVFWITDGGAADYAHYVYLNDDVVAIDNEPPIPETVDVSVAKTWDGDNGDSSKRSDITVHLYADGVPYDDWTDKEGNHLEERNDTVKVLTLNSDGATEGYTWNGLPGGPVYSVVEDGVAGYTTTYNPKGTQVSGTLNIKNKYIPGKTYIHVEKKWSGVSRENQPEDITVQLKRKVSANAEIRVIGNTGTLIEHFGVPVGSTVNIDFAGTVPTAYEDRREPYTEENNYQGEPYTAYKDGTRPAWELYSGDTTDASALLNSGTRVDSSTTEHGHEVHITDITVGAEGLTLRFPDNHGPSGESIYDQNNLKLSQTPQVTITGGSSGGTYSEDVNFNNENRYYTISAANGWKLDIDRLVKQDDDGEYIYYIEEVGVDDNTKTPEEAGYTVTYENNDGIAGGTGTDADTIKVTNAAESVDVDFTKTWVNTVNQNQDKLVNNTHELRVTVTLERWYLDENGEEQKLENVCDATLYGDNSTYASASANTNARTNYGFSETTTDTHGTNWSGKFTGLLKKGVVDGRTVEYIYKVSEKNAFLSSRVDSAHNDLVKLGIFNKTETDNAITNTFPETNIEVEKVWKNKTGATITPDDNVTVTVQLQRRWRDISRNYDYSGTLYPGDWSEYTDVDGKTLILKNDKWTDSFSDLPLYGWRSEESTENKLSYVQYEYQVVETGVIINGALSDKHYTTAVETTNVGQTDKKVTITNTETETTPFEFSKIWKDIGSNPTTWPGDATITVTLNAYTSDKPNSKAITDVVVTLNKSGSTGTTPAWTATTSADGKKTTFKVEGLAKYSNDGKELTYYVVESQVSGYKAPSYADKDGNGLVFTSNAVPKATNEQQIINVPEDGAELPSTGGPGTKIFTILGSILILGAGALLWRRRRTI